MRTSRQQNRNQSSNQSNQRNQQIKTMSLIRAQNLNVSGVIHDKIKVTNGGAKKVLMKANGGQIVMQLPRARVPFGLSCFENEKDASIKKYSLEVSLGGTPQLEKFREVLEELDEYNVKTIAENSVPWLKESKSALVIKEALYGSLIRPDKKGESPPRFKFKLPMWEGKPMFKVVDKDNNPVKLYEVVDGTPVVNWDWAQNGMEITAIVECEGLWVVNKNVYCTWRAAKIKVNKTSGRNDFDFMDEEDGSDNDNESETVSKDQDDQDDQDDHDSIDEEGESYDEED
jgi:hypothetical protein